MPCVCYTNHECMRSWCIQNDISSKRSMYLLRDIFSKPNKFIFLEIIKLNFLNIFIYDLEILNFLLKNSLNCCLLKWCLISWLDSIIIL